MPPAPSPPPTQSSRTDRNRLSEASRQVAASPITPKHTIVPVRLLSSNTSAVSQSIKWEGGGKNRRGERFASEKRRVKQITSNRPLHLQLRFVHWRRTGKRHADPVRDACRWGSIGLVGQRPVVIVPLSCSPRYQRRRRRQSRLPMAPAFLLPSLPSPSTFPRSIHAPPEAPLFLKPRLTFPLHRPRGHPLLVRPLLRMPTSLLAWRAAASTCRGFAVSGKSQCKRWQVNRQEDWRVASNLPVCDGVVALARRQRSSHTKAAKHQNASIACYNCSHPTRLLHGWNAGDCAVAYIDTVNLDDSTTIITTDYVHVAFTKKENCKLAWEEKAKSEAFLIHFRIPSNITTLAPHLPGVTSRIFLCCCHGRVDNVQRPETRCAPYT